LTTVTLQITSSNLTEIATNINSDKLTKFKAKVDGDKLKVTNDSTLIDVINPKDWLKSLYFAESEVYILNSNSLKLEIKESNRKKLLKYNAYLIMAVGFVGCLFEPMLFTLSIFGVFMIALNILIFKFARKVFYEDFELLLKTKY